jgi:hypothetical protein
VWFLHVKCDFHTQSGTSTRSVNSIGTKLITTSISVILTRTRVISVRRVLCYITHSMISTNTSLMLASMRVNMTLTIVIAKCSSVIYTRRVRFPLADCNLYTQCDFDRHKCDYNMHECYFNTHKSDFYTQSALSTDIVWFYTQSVISIHTNLIFTRMRVNITPMSVITRFSSVIYIRRLRFPHADCDFHTQSVISTGKNVIRTCRSVILARKRIISARKVQFPPTECDFTRRMWFSHIRV